MSKQEYYDHLNEGEKYVCDFGGCTTELGEEEFCNYILRGDRLCEAHWNYTHLKEGKCDKCGNISTNRSESRTLSLKCSCGGNIYMVISDG